MYENQKPHTEGPPERDLLEDRMRKEARDDREEIKRLRAALDRIAFCGAGEDYRVLREIARVALQPPT